MSWLGEFVGDFVLFLIIGIPIILFILIGYVLANNDIRKELIQKGCGEYNKTTGEFYIKDFSKVKVKQ